MPRAMLVLACALTLAATFPVHAGETYPKPIRNLQERGLEVVKSFEAGGGVTGYVLQIQGRHEIVYLTPDQKFMFVGMMLDEAGENLTSEHMQAQIPKPDLQAAWEQAEKSTWVAEGAASPKSIVYAFADPYCPFCNALWRATQVYHEAGLQVRWIPVAYLHPDSAATATAILEAEDPAAALAEHERNFDDGGIGPSLDPDAKLLAAVQANTVLMQESGIRGTPAVLYRDADGKVQLVQGMPRLGQLPGIFGLPEQPIDDPELARFR